MKFYRNLYLSPGLEKKKNKVIRKLKTGKLQINIYVIILASNPKNQLEICNSTLFLQPGYPPKDYFVVGITKEYEEALEVVEEITKEVYNETGGADIRSYIIKKEQEG